MSSNIRKRNFLLKDGLLIVLSIAIAVVLVRTDSLSKILVATKEVKWFGSFIAGMFFTSVFTAAPAMVTLGEIARVNSVLVTAILGALGSVVGDLIIFRFVRDRFSEHLLELLRHRGVGKRIKILFQIKYFRWLTFFAGGFIIASPFPDEIGISLLGFSKMKTTWFIPLSFTFNFIGIILLGLVAKSI